MHIPANVARRWITETDRWSTGLMYRTDLTADQLGRVPAKSGLESISGALLEMTRSTASSIGRSDFAISRDAYEDDVLFKGTIMQVARDTPSSAIIDYLLDPENVDRGVGRPRRWARTQALTDLSRNTNLSEEQVSRLWGALKENKFSNSLVHRASELLQFSKDKLSTKILKEMIEDYPVEVLSYAHELIPTSQLRAWARDNDPQAWKRSELAQEALDMRKKKAASLTRVTAATRVYAAVCPHCNEEMQPGSTFGSADRKFHRPCVSRGPIPQVS